ncbi:MAG: hydroxyacid dehydrogenase [Deltaproteobacteria bacterium]|nr:MAG: hydroxyacid dehydrogenase [Deltaproteobacteria bacterium]
MRVLLADKLAPHVAPTLEDHGCAVRSDPALKDDALTRALGEFQPEVLVVRSTRVGADQLRASRSLSLVIRAGAGVNTIDVDTASSLGIYVANCPGRNARAVAELTMGHLVNLDRRIADNVASLRRHEWRKKEFGRARGLAGATLAILGFGHIGQQVARRALAFDMTVRAWSRSLTPEDAARAGVVYCATPLEACRGADALTVHLPLNDETRGLVGRELLDALHPGAYVVNTARGGIVDEKALVEAIRQRGLRAGLDVYADEPAATDDRFDSPIADIPEVYGTHHIGASTDEATHSVGDEVIAIVAGYRDSGTVRNCVNLAHQSPATHLLVVRHKDEVGALAVVLDALRLAGINVQEMENIIFTGAAAACARIQLDQAPPPSTIAALEAEPLVIATSVVPITA